MRRGIAGDAQLLAFDKPRLVLAMESGPSPRLAEYRANALVIGDQKVASRGPHKDLDPGGAGQSLEFRQVRDIVMRAADPKSEIAMHTILGAGEFVLQSRSRDRQRIGIGHFEDRGHPA